MNLRKNLGRVASTIVATALLASVATVPAFAAEFDTDGKIDNTDNTALTEITFDKELVRPETGDTPDVTFTFTMQGVDDNETITDGDNTTVTEDATGKTASGRVTFGDADDQNAPAADGKIVVTDDVTINIASLTFAQPGVYKFNLTEAIDEDAASDAYTMGITSENPYSIYLFVERVDGQQNPVITGAELVKGSTREKGQKVDKITNYYMTTPTGVTPNALTVDKTVSGGMGNKTDNFTFTVTITADGPRTYSAKKGNETVTVTPGGNNTYTVSTTLSDGESFTINGLMKDDTYVVAETEADRNGYKTTVTGDATQDNQTVTFDAVDNGAVHYENSRTSVTPTGIVMNIAPYALLVVVAVAGCFVFLRKRNED